MIRVSTEGLAGLSRAELVSRCAKLSDAWIDYGMPPQHKMPVWMIAARRALQDELWRRGEQLVLFSGEG